jgi:hypothetical protein
MSIIIGTVTGREIKKNRDGDENVLILQCTFQEDDDAQSVELVTQAGEDTNPPDGSTVIVVDAGDSYKIGIAADDGIEPSMNAGEKKLYSIDSSGAIAAFVNFINSGIIELNGNGDFAVRFQKLADGLSNLDTQIQAELAKIATGISSAGGAYTPGTITTDISAAKVDEVKIK